MKRIRFLFIPLLLMSLVLAACSGNAQPATSASTAAPETETETEAPETMSPADVSELAMDNFLKKIDEGNYMINAENSLKASVFSRDLVWFDYTDEAYNDFAVMSVNNETFQAFLHDGVMDKAIFLKEGQAIEAASSRLPNHWMNEEVSEGNIYNLFYNSIDEPLTFVSYDDAVKQTLLQYAGYGENALRLMHEVYMVMDDVDPAVVHLTAEFDEDLVARISLDDIDLVISFGDAEDNPEAENWMSNPVYPDAKTEWDEVDEFIFNSVFLPGWGEDVIPFPPFASYAFTIDSENFVMNDEAVMRDSHATEQNMADYIEMLLGEGFVEVTETEEDGTVRTYYRKMLREEYDCYTSVELSYNDGLDIVAKKYYDFPVYDGLEAINTFITPRGYLELPADENIISFSGYDTANAQTESWLYFFNYDMCLYVDVDYIDKEKVETYLNDYAVSLVDRGFHPVLIDEDEVDYFESADGTSSFRYHFDENDALILLFKAEKIFGANTTESMISEAGFPEISLREPTGAKDLVKFQKVQYGKDFEMYLTVSQVYETIEEAEQFLSDYEAALNAAGFDRENPDVVGTIKPVAIYNEETGMLVAIDLIEQEENVLVNFEFRKEK